MNKFNINAIAIAIGVAFSAGAMALDHLRCERTVRYNGAIGSDVPLD